VPRIPSKDLELIFRREGRYLLVGEQRDLIAGTHLGTRFFEGEKLRF
jgi:hypothetical protein